MYNNKLKFLNIILSILIILTVIFSLSKPNFKMTMLPIPIILLSLQQLLLGVNYLQLNKRKDYIFSMGSSVFLLLCSIASITILIN